MRPPYNVLEREGEVAVLPYAGSHHLVVLADGAWILDHANTTTVCGIRRPAQFAPVAAIMGRSLDPGVDAEIDAIGPCCIDDPIGRSPRHHPW